MNDAQLKIGLFAIGLDAYWGQFEGLKERLERGCAVAGCSVVFACICASTCFNKAESAGLVAEVLSTTCASEKFTIHKQAIKKIV